MKSKIREFLTQRIGNDVTLKDEDNFFQLGLINSLFALQLVIFLEKTFQIEMDNEDLDINNFSTINNLTALVERKQAKSTVS
ncbi:MAG: acyl carrier protein [Bacteroidota bacterium]